MTVKELIEKLEDYGDHLIVKLRLEETTKHGQYNLTAVEDGRDHEDGMLIVEIRVD